MRGGGATFNTLYAADSDDDSDGFGCVFPKDNGFDTDSDGSDFSNLADDLFEKASVDSFEFEPPGKEEKERGVSYNRAKLDVDDDAVSVGSDREFQRPSKSSKKWDWIEEDEQSVGSDDDFEIPFDGRGNSVYDLKAGQGDVEDFLGGGGDEDLNEDFEFRTDFADTQRAEAFFNEGQGRDRGGVLVPTESIPAKRGAAQRRGVDPRFIAANAGSKRGGVGPDDLAPVAKSSSGKAKSAALISAGLAQASVKKGKGRQVAENRERSSITRTNYATGEVKGNPPVEAFEEEWTTETNQQAEDRINRSLIKLEEAVSTTTDEAGRERLEERLLAELEDISDDVRKGLRAIDRRGGLSDKSRSKALAASLAAIQARIDKGLSVAGMIQAAKGLMMLEHRKNQLLAAGRSAPREKAKSYQNPKLLKQTIKAASPARPAATTEEGAAAEAAEEISTEAGAPVRPPPLRRSLGEIEGVQLVSLGVKNKSIKLADGSDIDTSLGLDRLNALLASVEASKTGDADLKKGIKTRLKRVISDAKLALGLRAKGSRRGGAVAVGK